MEDGRIADIQITASSEYAPNHGPSNARLNRPAVGGTTGAWTAGAWCANSSDPTPWIQVDFGGVKMVSGVELQGRKDLDQWVKAYKVEYGNDSNTLLTAMPMDHLNQDKSVSHHTTFRT